MAHSGAAYASAIFTIIAGPTQEQLLIHEAILGQSPVFRAMTQLPFIEKQERTIRLPDDQASHLRCLVAFLYTSDFATESEPEYEPHAQKRGDDRSRRDSEEAEEETRGYGRSVLTRDGSSFGAGIVVHVLGDKYELPELKNRTLEKLDNLVSIAGHPLQFLSCLIIFIGYVPDPDDYFRCFVQASLQEAAIVAEEKEIKGEVVDAMIECGYLKQGGMLAEEILRAFASRKKRQYDGW